MTEARNCVVLLGGMGMKKKIYDEQLKLINQNA